MDRHIFDGPSPYIRWTAIYSMPGMCYYYMHQMYYFNDVIGDYSRHYSSVQTTPSNLSYKVHASL